MKTKIIIIVSCILLSIGGVTLYLNLSPSNDNQEVTDNKNNQEVSNADEKDSDNLEDKEETKKEEVEEDTKKEDNKNETSTNNSNKNNNSTTNNTVKDDSNKEDKKEESTNNKNETNKQDNVINNSAPKDEDKKEESPKEVTVIKEEVKEEETHEYIYGVKVTTTKSYVVTTYSDGTTKKEEMTSSKSYDKSTFNATTKDLKSEATILANRNKSIYEEVTKYVNQYRSEVNVDSLVLNTELSILATVRALEMAWTDNFSHTRPDGSTCYTVMDNLSYSYYTAGENIAWGQDNAKEVSKDWKDSEGHYKNMINSSFGQIGIGMAELNNRKYWVQLFTN